MTLRERIAAAGVDELPAIAAELAEAQAALTLRLHAPAPREEHHGPDRLLTMPEVAKRLGIGEWNTREMGRRGEIPTVHIGGRGVRVRESALNEYIRKHERGATMPGARRQA